jgi:hypothetical protein
MRDQGGRALAGLLLEFETGICLITKLLDHKVV